MCTPKNLFVAPSQSSNGFIPEHHKKLRQQPFNETSCHAKAAPFEKDVEVEIPVLRFLLKKKQSSNRVS